MVDWNTGKPNARLWVLRLLRENFGPGDKIVETDPFDSSRGSLSLFSGGGESRTASGVFCWSTSVIARSMISIPGATGGQEDYVDQTTAFDPPASAKLTGDTLTLNGLSVAVVTLP